MLPTGVADAWDTYQAADPKVWWDGDHWTMLYFGNGGGSGAAIMAAFSTDLLHWEKDTTPLYEPGGHPAGLDKEHAHKVWVVYRGGIGHMFYTAVGPHGRGIALLTSKPLPTANVGASAQARQHGCVSMDASARVPQQGCSQ